MVKFSGASWKTMASTMHVMMPPQKVKNFHKNEYHKIYYHRLGDTQDKDVLVYENKDKPFANYGASVTEDEAFLSFTFLKLYWNRNVLKDLQKQSKDFGLCLPDFKTTTCNKQYWRQVTL